MKSKDISEYVEAKISELRPGAMIRFDICLYLPQNRHILLWRKKGDVLASGFLEKYRARGVEKIWIHQSEIEEYYRYLRGEPAEASAQEPAAAAAAAPEAPVEASSPPEAQPMTEEGKKILETLSSRTMDERHKKAWAAKHARDMLAELVVPENVAAQEAANHKAQRVVQDVLSRALSDTESVLSEVWRLANVDPDFGHGMNVATFSVLFALAFGRIDSSLIADLALAGLIHDIGISQIPGTIAASTWSSFSPQERKLYSAHVEAGLELLQLHAPELPRRVRTIIIQQHEKFDGTGYPRRLEGFRVDDIAQLLAMADLLEAMSSGQWDGNKRTLREALQTLEKLEKRRTFPEHFNPEVFSAVMRWAKSSASMDSEREAVRAVERQGRALIQSRAG